VDFKVTVLGSGAALPTQKRNATAQFVECVGRSILIDCAEGTQYRLRELGIKIQKIQHILISHLHGDHYFGLVGLISTMHLLGRDKGLTIYGPTLLEKIIKLQLEAGGNQLAFDITFIPIDGNSNKLIFEDAKIEIHTFPLKHRIPTNGYLIKEKKKELHLNPEALQKDQIPKAYFNLLKRGVDPVLDSGQKINHKKYTLPASPARSYAFCSDTKKNLDLIPMLSNVDLLYHEATFKEQHKDRAKATYHSTAKQAAEIAKAAEVKKLLLGHFSARYPNEETHLKEAKSIFEEVLIAEDSQTYMI
jgi:ribonuclease Z